MNNKKIRKKLLRKARIWPSVVFLIFTLVLSFAAFLAFLTSSMAFSVQERFTTVTGEGRDISNMIDAVSGGEITAEKLASASGFTSGIYVLDSSGTVVTGWGEQSYDTNKPLTLGHDFLSENARVCYADTGYESNLIAEDGSLCLEQLLSPQNIEMYMGWFGNKTPELNTHIAEARFWTEYEISGGRNVLIKCTVPLYFRDFWRSLAMGGGAFIIMQLVVIFFFLNVHESVKNHRHVTELLYTDVVTGGRNWIYFEQNSEKLLRKRRSVGKTFAFADITVEKFRTYCNCHGVEAGDKLLAEISEQLSRRTAGAEISAHSGKSTFALFMPCTDKEACAARISTTLDELSNALNGCGIAFHAGICFVTPEKVGYISAADSFNRASAARAILTDENVNAASVYDDKILEEQLWEHKVEAKMQSALEKEEFKVYIQPKYDPVTEKLAGAEALVRWINEEDGFISPGKFIPIFEKNGFITKLDDYMLSHVAKLQAGWLAEGKSIVPISVNVSRAHFADPDLAQHIAALIDKYNVPHKYIEIELTESAFFDDKAALLRTVHLLRGLDFEISMDDFGAGYSSLNSLKDLPLDVLKLDADFFRGEDSENRGEIVVSEAIHLAKSLNMRIVAEGVEKKEQVDFLAGQGCDMIQGFYFAKPMPANEYEQRLSS